MIIFQVAMLVPLVGMRHLDEANSSFTEAPCHETLASEVIRRLIANTVHIKRRLGLIGNVHQLWRLGLHPVSKLKGLNASFEVRIMPKVSKLLFVQPLKKVKLHPLQIPF